MKRIGILSDTHGYLDEKVFHYFEPCDEIWHAGDIGSTEVAERLAAFRPLRAVYGNIDGQDLRRCYPEVLRWRCEEVEVMMKHIGGYPGRYDSSVWPLLQKNPPQLFIAGHSHILKIKFDKTLNMLHINPGAAGLSGWQTERTLVVLAIDGQKMADCSVIELGERRLV